MMVLGWRLKVSLEAFGAFGKAFVQPFLLSKPKVNSNSPLFWYFSIVYDSPQPGHRIELWDDLRNFNLTYPGPWCLARDFNTVLYDWEMSGGGPINIFYSSAFSNCIVDYNLIDLGYNSTPFTWKSGQLLERLDRVLCNPAWQNLFPDVSITHLPTPSFDHCGLWLKPTKSERRQGYFKFLGPWLDHPNFKAEVTNSWHVLDSWSHNINRTSHNLNLWNKEVSGNIFKRKLLIIRRLEGINRVLMNNSIERLLALKDQLWQEYQSIVKYEEAYWFQQAKSKWISLGDLNTRFFHMVAIQKRRRNKVTALQDSAEQWIYEDQVIKELVLTFYSDLYSPGMPSDFAFNYEHSFPPIMNSDMILIESPISIEETKNALFSMKNYKSPGPDGFHPLFFKSQWDIIGDSLH